MKKNAVLGASLVLLLVVAFLLTVAMPVAKAKSPAIVEGKIYTTGFSNIEGKPAGKSGNAIVTLNVAARWTGDIAGISTSESRWVWLNYVPPYGGGPINVHGVNTFTSAAVKIDGVTHTGTLTVLFLGVMEGFSSASEMGGSWVIIGGTGDLANLHGQGSWYHAEGAATGSDYTGQIHFDP